MPQKHIDTYLEGKKTRWNMKDAQTVVEALDDDKNGVVERNEFVDWVLRGLEKCGDDQQIQSLMTSQSEFGRKMGSFLLAMRSFVGGVE